MNADIATPQRPLVALPEKASSWLVALPDKWILASWNLRAGETIVRARLSH
jgi:hypothetical protein